jgi:hypothetical protein
MRPTCKIPAQLLNLAKSYTEIDYIHCRKIVILRTPIVQANYRYPNLET